MFQAEVSLNDFQDSESPCTFLVYGDDKELWRSNPVKSQRDTQNCQIPVAGVDRLKIAVRCDGPPRGAHAIWVDPVVMK